MTAAQPPTWPSSRVLAGWWPHLDRFHPRGLWLGQLLLHRVEAPVVVSRPLSLDRLSRFLLEALVAPAGMSAAQLALCLRLDAQFVGRLLAEVEAAGLAHNGGAWSLTEAGRAVLAGRHEHVVSERRTFYFAEGPPSHPGTRFLPLDRPPTSSWNETVDWRFDVSLLRDCAGQPAEWKARHGFPADVRAVATEPAEAWQQVIVDRAEQLAALFVLSGERGSEETLLGLAVQMPGWQLQGDRPVLELGSDWRESLPELAEEPGLEQWREAWRGWCQPRGVPAGEVEACVLERRGLNLVVRTPRPLLERLRTGRSEAVKGEAWLFAGEGRTRSAALVELAEL